MLFNSWKAWKHPFILSVKIASGDINKKYLPVKYAIKISPQANFRNLVHVFILKTQLSTAETQHNGFWRNPNNIT